MLIVGATSAIALAVAAALCRARCAAAAVGPEVPTPVAAVAADLRVRGAADVVTARYDALGDGSPTAAVKAAFNQWQGIDVALIAHGVLPDQAAAQASSAEALRSFDINARSVLALMTDLANRFEAQRSGVIGVISSPAGERGRASNYVLRRRQGPPSPPCAAACATGCTAAGCGW